MRSDVRKGLALSLLLMSGGGAVQAANPFEAFVKALNQPNAQRQQTQPLGAQRQAGRPTLGRGKTMQREVVYEGYTKTMLPIKKLIASGRLKEAIAQKAKQYAKPEDMDVLANLELGLMSLDASDVTAAQAHFTRAERAKVADQERSTVMGFFSTLRDTAASTVTGNAELSEYQGPGFERVLMLNYKSIAYMLEGDRKAYNVTRRAIDLQNIEKKKFDEAVRKAKEEIAKKEREQAAQGKKLEKVGFDAIVEEQYRKTDRQARKVPSAFVNPFGFYIAGVVQEIDSYEDRSLRDNARISYKKALELNPKSAVIKAAVRDLKRRAPQGKRLVHVVVGQGFAPEKKLLKFELSMGQTLPTTIELPIYEPVPGVVARVEAQTTGGKRWARLSPVADITALALRHQKDSGPLAQLRMMTTVIRNVIEGQAWNQAAQSAGVFGNLIKSVKSARDEMVHPDMRSWSTLPSQLLAARFYVPRSVSRFKLVSYDRRGRVLSSKLIKLDRNSHNFVYARAVGKQLYPSSSQNMWVGMR